MYFPPHFLILIYFFGMYLLIYFDSSIFIAISCFIVFVRRDPDLFKCNLLSNSEFFLIYVYLVAFYVNLNHYVDVLLLFFNICDLLFLISLDYGPKRVQSAFDDLTITLDRQTMHGKGCFPIPMSFLQHNSKPRETSSLGHGADTSWVAFAFLGGGFLFFGSPQKGEKCAEC